MSRLQHALNISAEAATLIMSHYQSANLTVESKSDASPVTIADRGAEELLRKRIAEAFPEDGILGEEFDDRESKNGYRWILDPIDGTKSFVHGVPLFGTLIGIEQNDQLVVGVARFPALNEVVYAETGSGAWWQRGDSEPRRAKVSDVSELSQSLLCVTSLTRWENMGFESVYKTLREGARLARGWGDCFGHILVATGRAEIMVDPIMSAWDCAALVPILQEAGGHFVDWNGKATAFGGNAVSTNAALLETVLQTTRGLQPASGE